MGEEAHDRVKNGPSRSSGGLQPDARRRFSHGAAKSRRRIGISRPGQGEVQDRSVIGGNRGVKIKGNDYRFVVKINYPYRVVYIRFVGTHAESDRIDAEEV